MASPRLTEPLLTRVERPVSANRPVLDDIDVVEIREELERILASPVFRNSKRNCSLLRHVVQRAIEGRPEELKERNIGVDVFGREADYDTNTDHVVRSVAGEVRRRLAQYYVEAGRDAELRIELLPGSYVPQFRGGAEVPVPSVEPTARTHPWRPVLLISAVIAMIAGAGMLGFRTWNPPGAFDRFWHPFFASPETALLCVGGGGQQTSVPNPAETLSEFEHQPVRRMHVSDALALAGLAATLQSGGKPYRILNRSGATSFRDLQSGPFVLIGGMNNEWTLRLTGSLRFGFERIPGGARVIDRKNPAKNDWRVDFTMPIAQFTRDFAIVSRVRDPETKQAAIIVAGIGSWGTLAASEFVSHPEYLKELDAFAPRHWEQKNLQVVISADVIRGSSGPPNILATYFW